GGSLTLTRLSWKVVATVPPWPSSAVTWRLSGDASAGDGLPLKVRVAGGNVSQAGRRPPPARAALYVSASWAGAAEGRGAGAEGGGGGGGVGVDGGGGEGGGGGAAGAVVGGPAEVQGGGVGVAGVAAEGAGRGGERQPGRQAPPAGQGGRIRQRVEGV